MNRNGMMSGIWKAAVVLVVMAAISCGPSVVASKLGINSEQEEIIAFTRTALQIEAERNSLMTYFAGVKLRFGRLGGLHITNRHFLEGMSEEQQAVLADWSDRPFEGMLSLRSQLLLLDVPQSLEPVKNSLVEAYRSEIGLAREQAGMEKVWWVYPGVTKDNIEALMKNKTGGYWGQVQLFRQQIYNRWAEILQEQGIDAAKEGFPELVVGK